jgi:hypothetical protein
VLVFERKAKKCQQLSSNGWMHRPLHTENTFFEIQNQSGARFLFVVADGVAG